MRRFAFLAALFVATPCWADYPAIPEPMVFDMMRPLGAKRGELEVNALAIAPLSGGRKAVEWAPEIEYAFADGYAIEFELPFENGRLEAYKLGLQAAFGASADGSSAHGLQYLGVYDRHEKRLANALLYMAGRRFDERWSVMTMVGLDDIRLRGRQAGRNALLLNTTVFRDLGPRTVTGLEINFRGGGERALTITPQMHYRLAHKASLQFGAGARFKRGASTRPIVGLRLIREL